MVAEGICGRSITSTSMRKFQVTLCVECRGGGEGYQSGAGGRTRG